MKGKNFSCNNVAGKRKKSDFYETPYSITKQLLEKIRLYGKVLEPACGNGAIVKELKEYKRDKIKVTSYDINTGKDFLKETNKYDFIVTNPPFSIAEQFIEHALEIASDSYFLLPLSYLHGKKRYDKFYNNHVLSEIFVFTRYPMLGDPLRIDGKYRTGMMVYAWFHFVWDAGLYPKIHWLDNNEYVISKKDL